MKFDSKEEIITFLNDKIGLKVSGISDVVYKEFSLSVISNFGTLLSIVSSICICSSSNNNS